MSELLTLAADFIERMSNPAYGIRTNEDYSLRLGSLLAGEKFEILLRQEIATICDPDTLSPHGWLWLLNWVRARDIRLDEELLWHLSETLSSVFMQVLLIDVATRHVDWQRHEDVVSVEEFDNLWLSRLLARCTQSRAQEDTDDRHVDTRRSQTVLVALMQLGSDVALDAASTLLNHRWPGQSRLVQSFWVLAAELDEETRTNWVNRLGPPGKEPDTFLDL